MGLSDYRIPLDHYGKCPRCGAAWGYENAAARRYSRLIGVEVRGIYDGVAYRQCPECPAAFHRFHAGDKRRERLEGAVLTWPPVTPEFWEAS